MGALGQVEELHLVSYVGKGEAMPARLGMGAFAQNITLTPSSTRDGGRSPCLALNLLPLCDLHLSESPFPQLSTGDKTSPYYVAVRKHIKLAQSLEESPFPRGPRGRVGSGVCRAAPSWKDGGSTAVS